MKNIRAVFIVVIYLGSLPAQTFIGKINPYLNGCPAEDDTIKILGVMVGFQEDRDGSTFGNGKFGTMYSQNYGNTILDPLPHDRTYFESHLEFVKNYFSKVSKGKVFVEYFILPDTFSVSQTMRNYSPEPNSSEFTKVGNFAHEVWNSADAHFPGFDFST
jgi:hypothetical protein